MAYKSSDVLQNTWATLTKNGWRGGAQKQYENTCFQPIFDAISGIEREIDRFDNEIEDQLNFLAKIKSNFPNLEP